MSDRYPTAVAGLTLLHAGLTDLGCRRQKNEDALGFFRPADPAGTYLLVVADGVGGSAAGEVASATAVEVVGNAFFAGGDPADAGLALARAFQAANEAIYARAAGDPRLAGMATTCLCAAIRGETVVIGHVGDCRAYMAVDGRLIQLTMDHSMANDYAREGLALPPEKEGLGNVLTRWLGHEGDAAIELSGLMQFQAENTLILCSDGLTKVVGQDEILHAVSMHLPGSAGRRLVDLARQRGGPDNITVQVARLTRA